MLVVGVCVVCVGPLGAACVVLGGGCVWDVFLSGLTAGEGSGMVFRAAALVVRGILERGDEGVMSLQADRLEALDLSVPTKSRDFR